MKIELGWKELQILANSIHAAQFSDLPFTKIKDKRIRANFEKGVRARHAVWEKLMNAVEEGMFSEEDKKSKSMRKSGVKG
jgi:hypothetical protein